MADDLSDLPPEVLKELRRQRFDPDGTRRPDELEAKLLAIIEGVGGECGIDTLLIQLWRQHQIVQKRRFLQNKLYRMMQAGLIVGVPGKKGFYGHAL